MVFLSRQNDHQAILLNYVHENQSLNSGFLIWLSNLYIYIHIQHQSKKIVYYLFDSHARDREGQLSENGASVLINFPKLEHLMEYLCHTYLDKTGKTKFIINFNFLCVVVQRQGRNSNKLVESTDRLCKLKKIKKQKDKN